MTLLLNCHSLSKSYGSKLLFKEITLGIFKGDKIGLVGPNGAGKSTLLKILCEIDSPDKGTISKKKLLKIGYIPQTSSYNETSIEKIMHEAMNHDYLSTCYEKETKVSILLSKLGFKDPSQLANTLSGGWKKRLDLAKELINNPDILFLDEPTNHLDLEGILWLESFLKNEAITFLVTSHDRYFLNQIATKTMELNPIYPEGIFLADGNYDHFVEKREAFFEYQLQCERVLATKVRSEVDWLRQSPKARTTKATARVQNAEKLIDDLSEIRSRNKQNTAKIDFESTDRQTRKLLTVKNIAKSLGDRLLFSGLDLTFTQGMRLGIVGMNGSGKTTLLKLLAGEIQPDKGTIKYAEGLRIVYFDQHRQMLNPNDTLRQALSPNSDTVVYRDQHIHVNSWGKRFLFFPDRMDLPVRQLSGGEKARIGIARLMLQPADLLLLDEPTNDLDIPTLETLEKSLSEFPGAIALITHDRALLDRLATCVIGLGLPNETPLVADYNQWEQLIKQRKTQENSIFTKKTVDTKIVKTPSQNKPKLSYNEKKELESMEASIIKIEEDIDKLSKSMHEHTKHNQLNELQKVCIEMDILQKEFERLFQRWEELNIKQSESLK
jgi:ATP-binding cassette subfamily F protein uup